MVIERFKPGRQHAMAERFRTKGRLMPDGVTYHGSWLPLDGSRCFQIMESPTRALLDRWVSAWSDLVDFEVEEVLPSAEYWKRKKEWEGGGVRAGEIAADWPVHPSGVGWNWVGGHRQMNLSATVVRPPGGRQGGTQAPSWALEPVRGGSLYFRPSEPSTTDASGPFRGFAKAEAWLGRSHRG